MAALEWSTQGQRILVEIEKKKRKTLRFEAMGENMLRVSCPHRCSRAQVLEVLSLHEERVLTLLARWQSPQAVPSLSEAQWEAWWNEAKERIGAEMRRCVALTGLSPSYVHVKELTSIWGSCTGKRGINLNVRLLYCPPEVLRYVVLHELCHLRHPNHSKDFWALVKTYDEKMKEHRAWLRQHGRDVLQTPLGLGFSVH